MLKSASTPCSAAPDAMAQRSSSDIAYAAASATEAVFLFGVAKGDLRRSLARLFEPEGWSCEAFDDAEAFVGRQPPPGPSCLIVDLDAPHSGGVELQTRVAARRACLPVIFLAAQADIATTVRAMKAGAFEFLTKPVDEDALVRAVRTALAFSADGLKREAESRALRARYEALSTRQREVMDLVVAGRLNKQICHELGISEITVKVHRGRVMEKMAARCLADLVRMSMSLSMPGPGSANFWTGFGSLPQGFPQAVAGRQPGRRVRGGSGRGGVEFRRGA